MNGYSQKYVLTAIVIVIVTAVVSAALAHSDASAGQIFAFATVMATLLFGRLRNEVASDKTEKKIDEVQKTSSTALSALDGKMTPVFESLAVLAQEKADATGKLRDIVQAKLAQAGVDEHKKTGADMLARSKEIAIAAAAGAQPPPVKPPDGPVGGSS